MKLKKKLMAVTLAALALLSLAAPTLAEGTASFESESAGIAFEYPESWLLVSEGQIPTAEEIDGAFGAEHALKPDPEALEVNLAQMDVILFDLDRLTDETTPYLGIVHIEDVEGIAEEDLSDPEFLAQVKSDNEAGFDTTWWIEPEAMALGENHAMRYGLTIEQDGTLYAMYQVTIVRGTTIYLFTYSCPNETLPEETIAAVDALMESLRFL